MSAAEAIEREILEALGLEEGCDTPNEEPNYEPRLRKLGAHLYAKGVQAEECLIALALHRLSRTDPKTRAEDVGLARQFATAARNLTALAGSAEELGAWLLRAAPEPEPEEPEG